MTARSGVAHTAPEQPAAGALPAGSFKATGPVLLILGLVSVGAGLVIRVVHRGSMIPGWDVLLTVEGEYLLATRGLWGALRETMVQVRTFWLPPSAYSIPYGIVPGALARAYPPLALLWQPLLVFVAWTATLAVLLRATGWPLRTSRGWGLALLACGASPALLSYAVEGYPWGGGMLPHALPLAIAFASPPLSWPRTLVALVVAWELPWHGYELGKTAGLTLVAAAALAPAGGVLRRLAWAITGASQVYAAWVVWPSHNMIALDKGNAGTGVGLTHALRLLPLGAEQLGQAMVGAQPLILPFLFVAGCVALGWAGKRRPVLAVAWAVQLGLVLLLAAAGAATDTPSLLRARRFQVVEGLSIAAILAADRRAPALVRHVIVALLLVGNAWTLADAYRYAGAPLTTNSFTLPGVRSAEGVGMVDPASVAWADSLVARAQGGEHLVLLHGQECPSEDVTNPVGVLERVYLRLGHRTFRDRVIAVATPVARYVTVPVIDVRTVLDQLRPGQIVDADSTCLSKLEPIRSALGARFRLEPVGNTLTRFVQFRLQPLG